MNGIWGKISTTWLLMGLLALTGCFGKPMGGDSSDGFSMVVSSQSVLPRDPVNKDIVLQGTCPNSLGHLLVAAEGGNWQTVSETPTAQGSGVPYGSCNFGQFQITYPVPNPSLSRSVPILARFQASAQASGTLSLVINYSSVSVGVPLISAACSSAAYVSAPYACNPSITNMTSLTLAPVWELAASNTCSWAAVDPATGSISGTPAIEGWCVLAFEAKSGSQVSVAYSVVAASFPQGVSVVKDVNLATADSNPQSLAILGTKLYFSASNNPGYRDLWQSDGTAGGTQVVKVINPTGDSNVSAITAAPVSGLLFFSANDGVNGQELWASDGTLGGTRMVKDINPGGNSSPTNFYVSSSGVVYFFAAADGINFSLWKTDGTSAGTAVVKDLNETYIESQFVEMGGSVYCYLRGSYTNVALWKTDGTTPGTTQLHSWMVPGTWPVWPGNSMIATDGSKLYMGGYDAAAREPWVSDGTAAGTMLLKDIHPTSDSYAGYFTTFGGKVYFTADDGNGNELWTTDGTLAGTVRVKQIYPVTGSNPQSLTALGAVMYFTASDATNGWELWKTDGTAANTVLVKDLYPGNASSSPKNLHVLGAFLYFMATDATGFGLFKTDGTAADTVLVKRLNGSNMEPMVNFGTQLAFSCSDQNAGTEICISDGTTAGTGVVKDIRTYTISSNPADLLAVNGKMYYRATNSSGDTSLWTSDGTGSGSVRLKDINPTGDDAVTTPKALGNKVYFCANDGTNGSELWASDGTSAGTAMVKDVQAGAGSGCVAVIGANATNLFFIGNDGITGNELWTSNGTSAGTSIVKDINATGDGVSIYTDFLAYNGIIYFQGTDANGAEPWRSDGTSGGTFRLKDINATGSSSPHLFTAYGGSVYFAAFDGVSGEQLYKTDGAVSGTSAVTPFPANVSTNAMLAGTNGLFILCDYWDNITFRNKDQLWFSDGTAAGTSLLKQFNSAYFRPELAYANGKAFFVGISAGPILWTSDGTVAGTAALPLNTGGSVVRPSSFKSIGNSVYFQANSSSGFELFKSDGTQSGTSFVVDVNPLPSASGRPSDFTLFKNTLYFFGDNGVNGRELLRYFP